MEGFDLIGGHIAIVQDSDSALPIASGEHHRILQEGTARFGDPALSQSYFYSCSKCTETELAGSIMPNATSLVSWIPSPTPKQLMLSPFDTLAVNPTSYTYLRLSDP